LTTPARRSPYAKSLPPAPAPLENLAAIGA
jgi:hypothetical protein